MDQADRDKLARDHMGLVDTVSKSMMRRFGSSAQLEDLRSFAMMGLASAIDNYDPDRGVPFAAYARLRMQGEIYDGLMEASWFPRSLVRKVAFYRKADEMTRYASKDPAPTDKIETTHRLGEMLKDITAAYITTYAGPVSEEATTSQAEAEFQTDRNKYYGRVRAYIEILPERHRELIKMHYFGGVPLKEVADHLGRSKSWASRVLRTSLQTLRSQFDETDERPLERLD